MYRFYYPNLTIKSKQILLTDSQENHHLSNVVRLKKGEKLQLFNGDGLEAEGVILKIDQNCSAISVGKTYERKSNQPNLILACAVPKKSKFETIIEKTTELGVNEIIPLVTKRTAFHLTKDRQDKKLKRYQTVALNAAKQSKRSTIPLISPIMDFTTCLKHLTKKSTIVIPSLMGKRKNLYHVLTNLKSSKVISFLIGPEGDFTPKEYTQAFKAGAIPVELTENILKVETAALATLSTVSIYFNQS